MTFTFQETPVHKGYLEGLILGDTRTGKSSAAENLVRFYKSGKYINCEGATLPGLIGGVDSYGSKVVFTWGVVPMQDGRLVILDESQDLNIELIGSLSAIRSRGVASRPIVGGERSTRSRVRQLWLANPRSNKSLRQYASGVDAIRELIGKEEDIARFDFALLVGKDEVDTKRFFEERRTDIPEYWTSDLASALVNWAWSRKKEHIKIDKYAERAILEGASIISEDFGGVVPTVQPSEMRIKMAKIAASVAAMSFSTDENNENLYVTKAHAEWGYMFLNILYKKKILGAEAMSATTLARAGVEDVYDEVKKLLKPYGIKGINYLLRSGALRIQDFQYLAGSSKGDPSRATVEKTANDLVRKLSIDYGCIYRARGQLVKHPNFTDMLVRLRDEIDNRVDNGEVNFEEDFGDLFE